MLHYAVLYYAIPYNTMPWHTVIVLYYAVIFHILYVILYHTWLFYSVNGFDLTCSWLHLHSVYQYLQAGVFQFNVNRGTVQQDTFQFLRTSSHDPKSKLQVGQQRISPVNVHGNKVGAILINLTIVGINLAKCVCRVHFSREFIFPITLDDWFSIGIFFYCVLIHWTSSSV